jgi:hypothetical protein
MDSCAFQFFLLASLKAVVKAIDFSLLGSNTNLMSVHSLRKTEVFRRTNFPKAPQDKAFPVSNGFAGQEIHKALRRLVLGIFALRKTSGFRREGQ